MYGMIRNALSSLVVARHGEERWAAICARVGQSPQAVPALAPAPDSDIYALIGAASEELGVPAAALLEAFGEHWIEYASRAGYRAYLDGVGDTLEEFLTSLDELHSRITVMLPELVPPQFSVRSIGAGQFELTYTSTRPGLAPMVIGIMRGLARYKRRGVRVELVRARECAQCSDVFALREWALEESSDVAA